MSDETEYRIDFTITRRQPGEDDFSEIGFGSSSPDTDIDGALYAAQSIIQNGQWETWPDQPTADEIVREMKEARRP
jgi:hypothetical protein